MAAVCTWPRLIGDVLSVVRDSGVKAASVAADFPSGRAPREQRVEEIEAACAAGAEEIDAVIDRGAFLADGEEAVFADVQAYRAAAGRRPLKVILETGGLRDYRLIRSAAVAALAGGADMLKTSTGKTEAGATLPAAVVLADTLRDFHEVTGRAAGLKVSGGIRTAEDALRYVWVVERVLGSEWHTPRRFRIGASSLLDDLVAHAR